MARAARGANELRFTDCQFMMPPTDGEAVSRESAITLALDRAIIGSDVYLNKCRVTGEVHAISTKIKGQLDFSESRFVDDLLEASELAFEEAPPGISGLPPEDRLLPTGVTAEHIDIEDRLRWKDVKLAEGTFLNPFQARASKLVDDPESWPATGQLMLEGFTYDKIAIGPTDADSRLEWLARQGEYHQRASTYRQLAAVLEDLGKERDADRVRIAGQRMRRKSSETGPATRAGLAILEATAGYGYRPGRVFAWIAVAILVGTAFFALADLAGAVRSAASAAIANSSFSPVAYSIDSFVPVIDFGYSADWRIGEWTWGELWAVAYLWVHITLGWILSGIAVVAVTGLSRRK